MIPALKGTGAIRLIKRDGDGSGGGISVFIEIDEHSVIGNRKPVGNGVDDAEVCLVRYDAGDVFRLESGALDHGFGGLFHTIDCVLEDFFPQHGQR